MLYILCHNDPDHNDPDHNYTNHNDGDPDPETNSEDAPPPPPSAPPAVVIVPEEFPDENTPLLGSADLSVLTGNLSGPRKKRRKIIVSLLAFFVLDALVCGVAYYLLYWSHSARLKVISMNVWGMPAGMGGCKFKQERIAALADLVSRGGYDLFLLQELWMQPDHEAVAAALPFGYHMTGFRQLASPLCDGRVLITTCSGLAIISKFPFKEVEFHMYTYRGTIWDGEALAGKGVGRARIELFDGAVPVDVFTTHTIADSGTTMANNTWYRIKQVEELMETYVEPSNASVVVLGGDFNSGPKQDVSDEPYEIIARKMTNSAEEIFAKLAKWLTPEFATYANRLNTFSAGVSDPITIDYIFHKAKAGEDVLAWSHWFELPLFKAWITSGVLGAESLNGTSPALRAKILESVYSESSMRVSLSDHEAIISTLYVRNPKRSWPF